MTFFLGSRKIEGTCWKPLWEITFGLAFVNYYASIVTLVSDHCIRVPCIIIFLFKHNYLAIVVAFINYDVYIFCEETSYCQLFVFLLCVKAALWFW